MRDTVFELVCEASFPQCRLEDADFLPYDHAASRQRRPDVLFQDPESGRTWVLDVTVADPQRPSLQTQYRDVVGGAAAAAAAAKRAAILPLIRDRHDLRFVPLAVETFGAMDRSFTRFLQHVSTRRASRLGACDTQTGILLFRMASQRISVALQRAQAIIIQRRCDSTADDCMPRASVDTSMLDLLALGPSV